MNKLIQIVLISACTMLSCKVYAQTPATVYRIGIFAPLYLDSVYNTKKPKNTKEFPRFALPGLEFTLGARIALQNINNTEGNIKAYIYDSKSDSLTITRLIESHQLDSLSLIIGSVKDNEFLQLANFAREKQIPFISTTYPNDGGITKNPYLFIVNSTLKTHCEAIFSFLLQNHSSDNILQVRKNGVQEDRISSYLNNINNTDGQKLLNITSVMLDTNYTLMTNKLDSARKNIIIGGSMDEDFASEILKNLKPYIKNHDILVIGMPNWDAFKFKKDSEMPIYFTSPYFNDKQHDLCKIVDSTYQSKYKKSPSDYTYKGFEITHRMVNLLIKFNKDFSGNINDSSFNIFSSYNFIPVNGQKKDAPNYYENKHLLFLKKEKGNISRMQ